MVPGRRLPIYLPCEFSGDYALKTFTRRMRGFKNLQSAKLKLKGAEGGAGLHQYPVLSNAEEIEGAQSPFEQSPIIQLKQTRFELGAYTIEVESRTYLGSHLISPKASDEMFVDYENRKLENQNDTSSTWLGRSD